MQHCLLQAGVSAKTKCSQALAESGEQLAKVVAAFEGAYTILEKAGDPPQGFIAVQASAADADDQSEYTDITPILLAQHTDAQKFKRFGSFDGMWHPFALPPARLLMPRRSAEALDEYFSKAESAKFSASTAKSAKAALSKKDKVRLDHERRIRALQDAQESSLHMVRHSCWQAANRFMVASFKLVSRHTL